MTNRIICILSLACACSLQSVQAQSASFAVSSLGKQEIVGTSSAVPNSGDPFNFSAGNVSVGLTFASFQLLNDSTSQRFADMRVTLAAVNGTLDTSSNRSGLMIAQTSNSQGLTDTGTLSVLTGFTGAGTGGESSVTLRFDFFEPNTATAKAVPLELTSFDFDFRQFLRVSSADFTAAAQGSKLTRTSNGSTYTFSDETNSNAMFNQATNAVVLNNVVDSSFEITVGKKAGVGNSLFMFEFRDPSKVLDTPLTPAPIPEPAAPLMATVALSLIALRRNRAR